MELKRENSMPILNQLQLDAVPKIQNAWRSYTNRKVYHYYRDIILLKTQTKPSQLLKAVNPCEAQLLEKASNLHIRFRLGGERFPPKIYYKVYAHGGVVDMNSFAPRDYSAVSQDNNKTEKKKMYYKEYKEKKPQHDGWYIRQENNGWRPLQIKAPVKKDFIEIATAHKVKYYHHDKDLRKKKNEKQKRLNKLRWFQTMFEKARDEEPMLKEQANPFEDPQLIDMDDDEFKNEVNELIEWSDNLDFDSYTNYWKQMSTSDYSGHPIQASMRMDENPSMVETEFEEVR